VSITDRDRKILIALIPLAIIAAYWFLLLAPKREESAAVRDQLTEAQGLRDTAQQKASQLNGAKQSFSADYATVIRLGKSIPTSVDMPSLLVQLDRAARGTGIKFTDIKAGERTAAAPAAAAATPATPATPAAPASGAAATPAAGAATPAGTAAAGTGTTALESVPLDFQFDGSFFDLADFFHRMKRFVRVANNRIIVRGRLLTVNSFSFDSSSFPLIKAQVSATVYLAPKAQGVDAGATAAGPAAPAATTPQTASSSPIPTPAATVTPR
jgi:Tfp pilus assembly protein PilO